MRLQKVKVNSGRCCVSPGQQTAQVNRLFRVSSKTLCLRCHTFLKAMYYFFINYICCIENLCVCVRCCCGSAIKTLDLTYLLGVEQVNSSGKLEYGSTLHHSNQMDTGGQERAFKACLINNKTEGNRPGHMWSGRRRTQRRVNETPHWGLRSEMKTTLQRRVDRTPHRRTRENRWRWAAQVVRRGAGADWQRWGYRRTNSAGDWTSHWGQSRLAAQVAGRRRTGSA